MPFGGPRAEKGEWKRVEDVLQEVVVTTVLSAARTHTPSFIEVKQYVPFCLLLLLPS